MNERLGLGRKLGFTVGDFACNIYWQSVSLYLLFFYTDVVGLSASVAGTIYMAASIWDGATDPVMGAIADRTRTRFGRYRPYLLFGGVPLGASFVLLYYTPSWQGVPLVAWIVGTHLLFRTCYTILSIPFTSLNARVTSSSSERSTLAGFRMIFATLAGLLVAATTRPLSLALGSGSDADGFLRVAALFALLATCIFPIVFGAVREPDSHASEATTLGPREYWQAVRSNRAFWVVMAAIAGSVVCTTALGKSILYYFKYYLDDEASSSLALSLSAASGLIIIPAWILVSRRIDKRQAWFVATGWGLAGLAAFSQIDIRSSGAMIAYMLYMQVAALGLAMTFWSMLPDTVEYGEWRSGVRTEAMVFGLGQFILKAFLGIGAGVFGIALDLIGYVPNQSQSASTLSGLKQIMVLLPGIGMILGLGAMWFYPLTGKTHSRLVSELRARRESNISLEPADTTTSL